MNREDMIQAIQIIIAANKDPKVASIKIYDFWVLSHSYKVADGKLIHKELGIEYK